MQTLMSSGIFESCKKKKDSIFKFLFLNLVSHCFLFFKQIHIEKERDVDSNRGNPTDEKGLVNFFFTTVFGSLFHSVYLFSEKS